MMTEDRGQRKKSRILNQPGGCRDARPSPEGEGPPSRGRPFWLLHVY